MHIHTHSIKYSPSYPESISTLSVLPSHQVMEICGMQGTHIHSRPTHITSPHFLYYYTTSCVVLLLNTPTTCRYEVVVCTHQVWRPYDECVSRESDAPTDDHSPPSPPQAAVDRCTYAYRHSLRIHLSFNRWISSNSYPIDIKKVWWYRELHPLHKNVYRSMHVRFCRPAKTVKFTNLKRNNYSIPCTHTSKIYECIEHQILYPTHTLVYYILHSTICTIKVKITYFHTFNARNHHLGGSSNPKVGINIY